MIDPGAAVASPVDGEGGTSGADQVGVRLVDPGAQPLDVLGALTRMGCPSDLAADYVRASAAGSQPEVLVGARALDAARVAEALRAAGAAVSVAPLASASSELPPAPWVEPPRLASSEPPSDRNVTSAPQWRSPRTNLLEVDTIERYIAAYNRGDRAALLQCLSATAVLSDATGQVLVHGAQAIGRRMADVFEHYPDRQVTVLGRLIARPWVLDHHRTSFGDGRSEQTVLCFRVEGDLIERLVLLR
jgi:hypothetical protein